MAKSTYTIATLVNPTCYADTVNAKFNKNKSHYVTLEERYNDAVVAVPSMHRVIQYALGNWQRNYPNVKEWGHFSLCRATELYLTDIIIDVTLQREFDVAHAADILNGFKQTMVRPIDIYFDPNMPGKGICWNGQHTVLVLFMIAMYLGIDPATIKVPVVITESNLKSEMRYSFISLSTDAVKPLDDIDIIHQKIYGVRTDGSTNKDWLEIELKQQYLEQNKIFLTHAKFGNITQPGAMTRVDKFLDSRKYHSIDTKHFAEYFFAVCNSSRPVEGNEIWIMYNFFRDCRTDKTSKITIDDDYISELAYCLNKSFKGNKFNPKEFADKMKLSYQQNYKDNRKQLTGEANMLGIQYPYDEMGATFLNAQLKKAGFSKTLPDITPIWNVPDEHLF